VLAVPPDILPEPGGAPGALHRAWARCLAVPRPRRPSAFPDFTRGCMASGARCRRPSGFAFPRLALGAHLARRHRCLGERAHGAWRTWHADDGAAFISMPPRRGTRPSPTPWLGLSGRLTWRRSAARLT